MPDEPSEPKQTPSRSADAAAIRWGDAHPDEDVGHPPPSSPDESADGVPNRHSASAEAASIRWRERQPDDEET